MEDRRGHGIDTLHKSEFLSKLWGKALEKRIPVEATVELTYGCNLRCVHCYNPTHKAKGELATEEFYTLLDQLAEAGSFVITFTGGEIFTRRDAFAIFAYAKKKGLAIVLFTNATLVTLERADRIQDLQPWRVEVSIYGATQETYEKVTRIPGSFRRFLRGIHLLRERRMPLLIKMPVLTLNQHEVKQAKALAEGWGVRFVYSTDITPRQDGSLEPLRYRIGPREVLKIDREIQGRQAPEKREAKECQASEGLFHCLCGKSSFATTPYGEMNLCVNFPIPRYTLRSGTVCEGWNALMAYVDSVQPSHAYECPSCDLQSHCRQGPSDAWRETGDLSPCLPYYKELARLEKEAETKAGSDV